MKCRELVREPGDSEALAAPRRVLNQVPLPGTGGARVPNQLANRVELLIAGKNERALARLAPVLVLLLNLVNELADEVENTVARPCFLPQVAGRIAAAGGRHRWVAGGAELALVEGQEARLRPSEP